MMGRALRGVRPGGEADESAKTTRATGERFALATNGTIEEDARLRGPTALDARSACPALSGVSTQPCGHPSSNRCTLPIPPCDLPAEWQSDPATISIA